MLHTQTNKNETEYSDYGQVQRGLEFLREKHNFTVCELTSENLQEKLAKLSVPRMEEGFSVSNKKLCDYVGSAVIGVTPRHPALKNMQHVAMENSLKHLAKYNHNMSEVQQHYNTRVGGPPPWTDVSRKDKTIAFLHPHTFYPCNWDKTEECVLSNFAQNNYTFAMHEWGGSWAKQR
ncbi:MAG: hypothetical protein SGARI_002467 [Bacillariaceae sp.]